MIPYDERVQNIRGLIIPVGIRRLDRILKSLLDSSRANYQCIHFDELCSVFVLTANTGKVMIPTDLDLKWIYAYEQGLVNLEMTSRTMRDKIKEHSEWSSLQHGFETHLYAIVATWAKSIRSE